MKGRAFKLIKKPDGQGQGQSTSFPEPVTPVLVRDECQPSSLETEQDVQRSVNNKQRQPPPTRR